MTSIITEVTGGVIASNSYRGLSATFGVIAILLLLLLLIQKEILRVFAGARLHGWMRAFNLAIAPLLMAFGLIVIVRFLILLIPGLR